MAEFKIEGTTLKKCKPGNGETEIRVPDGVTRIAKEAFEEKQIESVWLPDGVTFIGFRAFCNCKSLRRIRLPEGLQIIDEEAFSECPALTEIRVPDSVTEIRRYAFAGCSAMPGINLPAGLKELSWGAICGCHSLQEIRFPEGMEKLPREAMANCTSLKKAHIPQSVTEIGMSAFSLCGSLEEIRLPDGLTRILMSAFNACSSLTEITLPESLQFIGGGAFSGSGIQHLRIPPHVTSVEWSSFLNCPNLKSVEFAAPIKPETKIFEQMKTLLWKNPEMAQVLANGNSLTPELAAFLRWAEQKKVQPKKEFHDDRPWYESIIDLLQYDDYILIKYGDPKLYRVIEGEYKNHTDELFGNLYDDPFPYQVYGKQLISPDEEKSFRAYVYRNGRLAEIRDLDRKAFDPLVYKEIEFNMILRAQFGLEPKESITKAWLAEKLAEVQEFQKTLFYACYVNDTPAIIERVKKAKKADLNCVMDDFNATPLILCARNNNLEGFKALAEAGADIKKTVRRWFRPLDEARCTAPEILRYVFETYPEIYDSWYGNWQNNAFYCRDWSLVEDMFKRYGPQGLEECYFPAMMKPPVSMDTLEFLTSHHVDCTGFIHPSHKCNAVTFAEKKCQEFPDDEGMKEALNLIRQEAAQQSK